MSQANVESVREGIEGWNRGDFDAFLHNPHPDIEFVSDVLTRIEGTETVWRGPAGLRKFWDEWHALWNLTIEPSEIRDLGETVLALGRMRTLGHASGVALESPVAYVFEFEEGMLRKVRAYLETSDALRAVGLSR